MLETQPELSIPRLQSVNYSIELYTFLRNTTAIPDFINVRSATTEEFQ